MKIATNLRASRLNKLITSIERLLIAEVLSGTLFT